MEGKIEIRFVNDALESKIDEKDLLNIVMEEWKDLREEIKARVEQRTQLTEIMVALVSGLLTAAATAEIWGKTSLVFCFVPFVTFFFMFLIKSSYKRHRWLTKYIREEIEDPKKGKISRIINTYKSNNTLIGINWLYWETYFKKQTKLKGEESETNRARAYNGFNIITFLLCGTILLLTSIKQIFVPDLHILLIVVLFFSFGSVLCYFSTITKADIVYSEEPSNLQYIINNFKKSIEHSHILFGLIVLFFIIIFYPLIYKK